LACPARRNGNPQNDIHIEKRMVESDHTVLSLNPDGIALERHELELRNRGFVVISVSSPVEARFEIEKGRCGVFLTSYLTPPLIRDDLVLLFRRSCPQGTVVYVTQHPNHIVVGVDVLLLEPDQPGSIAERINAVRRLQAS
jgi:hypothetical protein